MCNEIQIIMSFLFVLMFLSPNKLIETKFFNRFYHKPQTWWISWIVHLGINALQNKQPSCCCMETHICRDISWNLAVFFRLHRLINSYIYTYWIAVLHCLETIHLKVIINRKKKTWESSRPELFSKILSKFTPKNTCTRVSFLMKRQARD